MQEQFTARMMARYQRQMVLPEVGLQGQEQLMNSRVLFVGAGALGSAAAVYLAAAGVGTIGIVDGDTVELSNLHRQILHDETHIGDFKTHSAHERLETINPHVQILEHREFLTRTNAFDLFAQYDLIINGSDNFPTRYLVNDAAVLLHKPLIDAAILRFEGQLAVYRPGHGCYRCLFPVPPDPGTVPDCALAGVFGAVAGVMGSMQAVEALKMLLHLSIPDKSVFMIYDALSGEWQRMPFDQRPTCDLCGDHPSITALVDYEAFCGIEGHPPLLPQAPSEKTPTVSIEEARQLLQQPGTRMVDVRSALEFSSGHVPNAENYPLEDLDRFVAEAIEGPVIVMCAAGIRSAYASQYLRSKGIEAFSVSGGTSLWHTRGEAWTRS